MATKKNPATYAEALAELRKLRTNIKDYEDKKTAALTRRDEVIALAAQFPESSGGIIARSAGVAPARVSQLAPLRESRSRLQKALDVAALDNTPGRARAVREAERAGVIGSKTSPAAAALAAAIGAPPAPAGELPGVNDYVDGLAKAHIPAPMKREVARELPGIGDTPITVEHGAASERKWTAQKGRETVTLHWSTGRAFARNKGFRMALNGTTAAALLAVLPPAVERVIIVGDKPWHDGGDSTMTADVQAWLTAPLPEGWSHGNHFPHAQNPVGRFTYRTEGERPRHVEVQHLGSWVPGDETDDPAVVWQAFRMLRDAVRQRWGSETVELLGSPTTLGQDLWSRTIPQNIEYPLMSQELRELIRTTSGQGRFELRTAPAVPAELPSLHYYDCTWAYAGLTWGMPVGAPTRVTAREFEGEPALAEKRLRGRGRWHVRATVPPDWTHVGLLPCSGAGGWEYPAEPGRTFTAWASGPEVWLARQQGWAVEVLDGITWAEGKPLNLWRDRLVECWQAFNAMAATAGDLYARAAKLAAKMVRSVVLFTIGGFHSKGVARKGVATSEAAIPATATRAEERGGTWTWQSDRQASGNCAHPEWSAEVYGRMRARLLSGPNGVGALHLKPAEVVAFRSDALFVTRETGWTNPDNTPGRFRHKGSLGAVTAPTTEGELLALRDRAEGGR